MRKDMAKVLVERPRKGSGLTRPGRAPRDLDDLPTKEGMRRRHIMAASEKNLNEHIAPLKRYLRSNCGRPWNKVYSEICKHIKLTNTVQRHILEHVKWFVEQHVIVGDDGRLYSNEGRFALDVGFYVCPRSGLLRASPKRKRVDWREERKAELSKRFRVVGENKAIVLYDGQWYEAEMCAVPRDKRSFVFINDAFIGFIGSDFQKLINMYGSTLYAKNKRQISAADKRRYKVKPANESSRT